MDIFNEFKSLKINKTQLIEHLQQNQDVLKTIKPCNLLAKDITFVIKMYLSKNISKEQLMDWIGVVGNTQLYICPELQSDCINSAMVYLVTITDDNINNNNLLTVVHGLQENIKCPLL